ncbi:MAG: helix-turn-helix domain-containing protein [Dorea sp.]|nr:helix-turn-helix domain-containing protein [Dorea sp.]
MEEGIKQGKKEGLKLAREILRLYRAGISPEQIAKECGVSVEEVKEILE